jgi:hypothetical protein
MSLFVLWQLAHLFANSAAPSGGGELGFREHPGRQMTAANPRTKVASKRELAVETGVDAGHAMRVECTTPVLCIRG